MGDLLYDFLKENVSFELLNIYLKCIPLFEKYEVEDNLIYLEQLIMDESNLDKVEITDTIYLSFDRLLSNIIAQYSIYVNDGVSLNDKIMLIESLIYLEDYEDKQAILEILSLEISHDEKLLMLLALVSMKDENDFFLIIEKSSPLLLAKLEGQALTENIPSEADIETIEPDKSIPKDKIALLKNIALKREIASSLMLNYVKNDLTLYLPLKSYLNLFGDEIFDDSLTVDEIICNLIVLAVISSDEDPQSYYTEHLKDYVTDPNKLNQILFRVKDRYAEITHE